MSDADLIKAKLAGLQIHLSYLEGWLRTHKGAMQEFKMRTLHDIVTGKKKYVVQPDHDRPIYLIPIFGFQQSWTGNDFQMRERP